MKTKQDVVDTLYSNNLSCMPAPEWRAFMAEWVDHVERGDFETQLVREQAADDVDTLIRVAR